MFGRKKVEPKADREYVANIFFNGQTYGWRVAHPDNGLLNEYGSGEPTEESAIESAKKCINRLIAMDNYKPVEIRVPAHLETA
jgi:hypothetical protein